MKKLMLVLAAAMAGTLSAAVFDENTIAFYPLDDQPVGTVPNDNDTVKNAVDGKPTGIIRRFCYINTYIGLADFSSDVPGKYIYSDWAATNLLTSSVQSLHFQTNNARPDWSTQNNGKRTGGGLLVREAAETLDQWTGDWTVEFFYKLRTGFGSGSVSLPFRIGGAVHTFYIGNASGNKNLRIDQVSGAGSASYDASLIDDQWHHVAIIYDSATGKVGFIGDYQYGYKGAYSNFEIDNGSHEPGDSLGIVFGGANSGVVTLKSNTTHSDQSTKDIYIAAPRFTKRRLQPKEMLLALPAPALVGDAANVHWSLEGEDGAKGVNLANRFADVDLTGVTEGDWFYAKNKLPTTSHSLSRYYAMGVCTSDGGKDVNYFVESDRRKTCVSTNGVVFIRKNLGGVKLANVPAKSSPWMAQTGSSFGWTPYENQRVTGAFTFEGFFKLDFDMWKANVYDVMVAHDSTRWRMTAMGLDINQSVSTDSSTGVFHLRTDAEPVLRDAEVTKTRTSFMLYYSTKNDDGVTYVSKSTTLKKGNATFYLENDSAYEKKWHHFAVTWDPELKQITVYVDYQALNVISVPNGIFPEDGTSWKIGQGFNNGTFPGWVDEVRLTRRALQPNEFLKMATGGGLMILLK